MRIPKSFLARKGTCLLTITGLALAHLLSGSVLADGCFVFKWDKNIDINEPSQKAVILHQAGREDLLLQVKYEGPLQDFGWLIPVPSLPKVEKGSMDAFYELSLLTQQHLMRDSWSAGVPMSSSQKSAPEPPVKVIEVKTVGAYEIAVLSAHDAGSLQRWLKSNDYSFPAEKAGIVSDYIRRKWYFIAVKIQLNAPSGESYPKKPGKAPTAKERVSIQKKLASGELHPLLISFDTPTCIFPLKISAVGGKPSEVLLYVLSEKPLCNRFLYDENRKVINQRLAQAENQSTRYAAGRRQCEENNRVLRLSFELTPQLRAPSGATFAKPNPRRSWTVEDLQAIVREDPPTDQISLEPYGYATGDELLDCFRVSTNQIPKSARTLSRLKGNTWYLTKAKHIFSPAEMHDLEFKPAVPMLADTLAQQSGRVAGLVLASFGPDGGSALLAACRSTNSTTRENASFGLIGVRDPRAIEPLLILLKDQNARTRHNAVQAAAKNWDKRFIPVLQGLFNDPHEEIRDETVSILGQRENRDQTQRYLSLTKDPDWRVCACALSVLCGLNPDAIPVKPVSRLLKASDPEAQEAALHVLGRLKRDVVSRPDLLAVLSGPRVANIRTAINLIENLKGRERDMPPAFMAGPQVEERERWLTSSEATVLVTNRFTEARLIGLGVLRRNADAKAIELMLKSLRDPNPVVREKAFSVIKLVTNQNISDDDAAKWESWWASRKPAPTQKTTGSPRVPSKTST